MVLVVLMGISITGIIIVQLTWINNAVRVKNELFDRSVNEALINTVNRLDVIHNYEILRKMMVHDSDFRINNFEGRIPAPFLHFIPHGPGMNMPGVKDFGRFTDKNTWERDSVIRPKIGENSKLHEKTFRFKFSDRDKNADKEKKIHPDSISLSYQYTIGGRGLNHLRKAKNNIFVFSNDTLHFNTDSLILVNQSKIDSIVSDLDTSVILEPEIKKRIEIKAGTLKNFTGRVFSEIVTWDTRKTDLNGIDSILNVELRNKDISTPHHMGIIQDNVLTQKLPERADSVKLCKSGFNTPLYPNDIFQKNIKLAVLFPEKERLVYRSLNWLLLSSFLFSAFILLAFAMSIYYLLKQKKISEMKSDFINNMTHEFKTPIATISVAADSIVNEKIVSDPQKIRYFAAMIKKENSRMNRRVEDILTIARLERKEFEFDWAKANIHELISDAVQGISLQVEKKGGKIVTLFHAGQPVVTTDTVHFTNVLFNLLDNALKYSNGSPKIMVSTENAPGGVILTVEDNGIGMTRAVQAKIFERFYRQTTGNIHNVKGFGLGLSYSKAVIEANKGSINVQSEPGKGSKFTIFIPFERDGTNG